jgi:uncharacterized membrane protein (GlpM family)
VKELIVRFVIGGLVVSTFAVLGDLLKPKSFAGLFSAAPSIALASLGLAVAQQGSTYASSEAKSMMLGAAAFILYAWIVSQLLFRAKLHVLTTTVASLVLWLVAALTLWAGLLR